MIPATLAELAVVTGGRVDGDDTVVVSAPAFLDTRTPEQGGLFAAFDGEHVDGHDFARAAVDGGAAAVLGTRPTGVPTLVVADTRAALQDLARWHLERVRRHGGLRVVAITGSQGKTSAKDMLARVLADHAPTIATAGSFNNEIGLPLTVLRATAETRHLVLEMGARGIGHLTELCGIARPDVSLVLNVGKAHLGEFGSQANIAQAKGEIVEALPADGHAVLNADDPLVRAMASRTDAATHLFGTADDADLRLAGVELDELGRPGFTLSHAGETEQVQLRLLGAHQAANAAATVATAVVAGVPFADACASLREVDRLSHWRMEVHERADGLVVVNDAYNANPDSMRAALETLATIGARSGRRTVAVLGEMRELGDSSAEEHRRVGELARELGIDAVHVVGEEARGILAGYPEGTWSASRDEVSSAVRKNVSGSEVVLVKASRGAALEKVAEELVRPTVGEHGEEGVG